MKNQINLIDGSELECYPIALQPKVAETDNSRSTPQANICKLGRSPISIPTKKLRQDASRRQ